MKRIAIAVVTFSGLAVMACGTAPGTESVVCSDFRVGADMSHATFGVEGSLAVSYVAFAQAAADVATVSSTLFLDVSAACEGLARDLGGDFEAGPAAESDQDRTVRVCKVAAARVATARKKLEASHVKIALDATVCTPDAAYQTECEATCQGDARCAELTTVERCAPDDREGVCPGECTGTCTGGDHVDLEGSDGTTRPPEAHCDGRCRGGCTEDLESETCTGTLAPPRCAGDVDCQSSCSASAVARGSCTEGGVSVSVDPAARSDDEAARAVAAFERHLPTILMAAQGRAQILHDGASSLVDAAGHVLARGDELGKEGAACGIIIGRTGEAASRNLEATLDGARAVARAVDGD